MFQDKFGTIPYWIKYFDNCHSAGTAESIIHWPSGTIQLSARLLDDPVSIRWAA